MTNDLSAWDEVRRLADEVEVRIHLAGMDARDRWHELEPRLETLEQRLVHSGESAGKAVVDELHEIRDVLRALRDDLYARAHDDFVRGW